MKTKFYFIFTLLFFLYGCHNKISPKEKKVVKLEKIKTLNLSDKHNDISVVGDFLVDENDNICILDIGNFSIVKINKNLRVEKIKMCEGKGPCEVLTPRAISVDNERNIYILDLNQLKIVMFDSLGNCLGNLNIDFPSSKILAVSKKKLLVYNFPFIKNDNLVQFYYYNAENKAILKTEFHKKIWKSRAIDYSGNTGRIIKDSFGNIYASYFFPYRIFKYSPKFKLLKTYKREPAFFTKPILKNHIAKNSSGLRDIFIINNKFLGVFIFYDRNGQIKHQIDIFDIKSGKYVTKISDKQIEMKNIKYIRSNNKDIIYICTEMQEARITEYRVKIY